MKFGVVKSARTALLPVGYHRLDLPPGIRDEAWPYGTPDYIQDFLTRRLEHSRDQFRQLGQILAHGDPEIATLPAVWQVATESLSQKDLHLWRTLPAGVQHEWAKASDELLEAWAVKALHIPNFDQAARWIAALPATRGGLNLPRPTDLMPIHRLGALLSIRHRRCGETTTPWTPDELRCEEPCSA